MKFNAGNNRSRQRGGILMLMTLSLPVLLATAGIVVDKGYLYVLKRQLQVGTDATAISAAHEIRRSNPDFEAVALRDAQVNGIKPSGGDTVVIARPPTTGSKIGDTNYVEVTVTRTAPLFFMKLFRAPAPVVAARSVAGIRPQPTCVYAMNRTRSASLDVGGAAEVDVTNCQIHVNSSSSTAAQTNGGGIIQGDLVNIVGGYVGDGFVPTPTTGVDAVDDPLAGLAAPPYSLVCNHIAKTVKKLEFLSPGVYCGGISVTTSNGEARLAPGTYVLLGGGLSVGSGSKISGTDVTFYNTIGLGYPQAPLNISAGSTATLSAPTSGPYKGILFFQDRSVTLTGPNLFSGSPDGSYSGAFYLLNNSMEFVGGSSAQINEILIVADTIKLRGKASLRGMQGTNLPPLATTARLVE